MTVKSTQAIAGAFCTVDGTGALTAATGVPVGTLYVAGVASEAVVTITGENPYKWAVTLPTLTAGQTVQVYITATVSAIATGGIVWADVADTSLNSDVAAYVDDMATESEIAAAVWDRLTSALTTVGSVGALVAAKLGLITSGTVSVSSPVASNQHVTTIQGDDYDAADGRAIEWTVASTATLTGGTVAVIIEGVDTYVGSVVDETTIRLELTAAQTAAIPVGPHRYQVIHTQTVALGEDVTTLVQGTWTSARRVSA